jgi:D-glycero-alpha-D-manno-heptose 1-phosphate guanylyltransferase
MEAIVLVGGLGTRLRNVVSDRPKVLAPIGNKPFLDFILKYLVHYEIDRIVLSVCYKKEQVQERYGNRFEKAEILYCEEEEPLGTGGAIQKSLTLCRSENVFVLNGDSLFLVPLDKMKAFHEKTGGMATLAVRQVPEGSRYGRIVFDGAHRILNFVEKEKSGAGYINGGVYYMNRRRMEKTVKGLNPPFSIEKDIFPKQKDLFAFPTDAFFIDIGTPESWQEAQTALPAHFPF